MKACILIKTRLGRHNSVAKRVSKLGGVSLAFPVLGRTDVVANVSVKDLKELGSLAFEIGGLRGVLATETLIALEV